MTVKRQRVASRKKYTRFVALVLQACTKKFFSTWEIVLRFVPLWKNYVFIGKTPFRSSVV